MSADLTDTEIDGICEGLTQNAARVRYLKRMGLVVRQKPNGRPLVNRAHYDAVTSGNTTSKKKVDPSREPAWSITA
jgi:hypothetical protein